MKRLKLDKSHFFCFSLGLILAGCISAAAITITAKEVTYSPSNPNFKVNNSDDALNFLYKLTDYEVPANTYFYDKTTSGENIKRYKKQNDQYYECNQNGNILNKNPIRVNQSNMIEYKGTNAGNLTAGSAGYANKNLVLGNSYKSAGKPIAVTKSFDFNNNTGDYIDITIDCSDVFSEVIGVSGMELNRWFYGVKGIRVSGSTLYLDKVSHSGNDGYYNSVTIIGYPK